MRVKLIYSHDVVEKPILASIVLRTGVPINILEAKVNAQKGELIVSIPADGDKLREVLNLFREAGVQVQEFTETLRIDWNKCMACGACISPCPTGALRFKDDWSIEFDDEKCVACKVCVTACPVRAISPP
ncbi:MAG: 4Fe-4S binding protein [Candidatus Bathyarchaeota archaeon]|nr:4Fe-4S binding protein [Candidatus Bathyarchaeota archaeon]